MKHSDSIPSSAPEPIVRDREGKIISPLPEVESLRLPSGFSLASIWDPFVARVRALRERTARHH
ncbi:MAG TPA: hypothetical protein VID70_07870 [Solirubrobacteraceae bacterium]